MPITNTNVTVGGAATALVGNPTGSPQNPTPVSVYNPGVASIFTGGSGVTPSNGIPIAAGGTGNFSLTSGNALYGIVSTATQTVAVMQGNN